MNAARFIVERYGTDSLSYFALRDDKEWFGFRDTMVAYHVHNGVALVSPDPIGPVGQRAEAWGAFREFADEHGWPVAVMGASHEWLPAYRASGMHDLYIGDEAVVDVRRFSLEGKQNKSLRQSVARVEKSGYHVDFFDPTKLDETLRAQLRDLMGESRKRRRRARILDDARARVPCRRPRTAARGGAMTPTDGPRGSVTSCRRARSRVGRST